MLTDLLEKYNQPAPRYTSYPPVPHWSSARGSLLTAALEKSRAPLSVYVHIPFCERLCLYCGCNVVIRKEHSTADAYVDRLIKEINLVEVAHGRSVTQMHWGGGTPTYLKDAIDSGNLPVFRGYVQSQDDVIRGAVIEECLCSGRISKDALEKRFNIHFDEYFGPELAQLKAIEQDGLIKGSAARHITVTPDGRFFIRSIAKVFDAFQSAAIASKAV